MTAVPPETARPKRWSCRIGWHRSVFSDGAMFTSARRCNYCLDWLDPAQGAQVERERAMWQAGAITLDRPSTAGEPE